MLLRDKNFDFKSVDVNGSKGRTILMFAIEWQIEIPTELLLRSDINQ
jgi:hypothetical protein